MIRYLLSKVRILRQELILWKEGKYKNLFQFRKGFFNSTVEIDGINKDNYKNFLSDRSYKRGHPWNSPFSGIIDNKLFLPYLLYNYKKYLPKTYLFKDKSGFLPIFDGSEIEDWKNKVRVSSSEILPILKEVKSIVLKHVNSSVGMGFHLVNFKDGLWYIDNKFIEEKDFIAFIDALNNYIFQEKIVQAEYSESINSSSINTIRLQCAWNKNSKSFEVIRAFHRFGSNGQLVDNLGQGNGILVYVNPESGMLLQEGVININGIKTYKREEELHHPESNIKLSGLMIPGYKKIKDKILEISNSISYLRWLGWDIAITPAGFKIIEINSLTTLDTIQQREGFLGNEWISEIFNKNT